MVKVTNKFISIEGVEGVGKSTIVEMICALLDQKDEPYVLTREPGGTPIAESIRQVLLAHHEEPMCHDTELLLMFGGRAQNIEAVIKPALSEGKWVISDRFTDASFAYQGGGRQIDDHHIQAMADWVQGDLWPSRTILLDAPVEVGFSRMASRGVKDRIEREGMPFFERVRSAYLARAKADPVRFRVVDATQSLEAVSADVLALLQEMGL